MKVEDTKDICPFCGHNDCQVFTYTVFVKQFKSSVCKRCSKGTTVEIKEEQDDK